MALNWPHARLTYAGRLDPLAEGVLPVVYGSTICAKDAVLALPKEYEARILLGVSTDSYDILGIPQTVRFVTFSEGTDALGKVIASLTGEVFLAPPLYSSVPYRGKPLHVIARTSNNAASISPPSRTMVFNHIHLNSSETIESLKLLSEIEIAISRVKGDFRQSEILRAWNAHLAAESESTVLSISLSCASGSYVRSLAHELGQRLGCGACIVSLRRIAVGAWREPDCISLL